MPRIALGWVSGAEVEGLGLTLRFKDVNQQIIEVNGGEKTEGVTMHFTRVTRREHLFVRLVSMGRQRWEIL
jgi:ribosomal protein S6E (S10)